MDFYHSGMRELQDRYEGRAVPDRLAANRMRDKFNDEDREFIETSPFFFLATATQDSVDCSFKGGEPGFVRVVGDRWKLSHRHVDSHPPTPYKKKTTSGVKSSRRHHP